MNYNLRDVAVYRLAFAMNISLDMAFKILEDMANEVKQSLEVAVCTK
jgi:ribosomal protein S25